MTTLHDRFVKSLTARGCRIVSSRTRKYTVLADPSQTGRLYFVGRAGAVRVGSSVITSRPISDRAKERLLAAPGAST